MNDDKKIVTGVTPEVYAQHITTKLVTDMMTLITQDEQKYGLDWALTVKLNIVASVVATLVLNNMNVASDAEAASTGSLSQSGLPGIKDAIESAVAVGFQSAIHAQTGDVVDFFVQVSQVPDPVNKMPC